MRDLDFNLVLSLLVNKSLRIEPISSTATEARNPQHAILSSEENWVIEGDEISVVVPNGDGVNESHPLKLSPKNPHR
jgi:hypothetical protein